MRHQPWRLAFDNYPISNELSIRFGDMDYNGHVNNVAIYQLYDEARTQINEALYPKDLQRQSDLKVYIVDVHLTFLGEAFYPGTVQVATGIMHVGKSSFHYGQAMFQNSQCIGLAEAVAVYARQRVPASLPEDQRLWLQEHQISE